MEHIRQNSIQDTGSLGGSKEFLGNRSVHGRNVELKTNGTVACSAHSLQFTFTLAELLDNGTGKFFRNINVAISIGSSFFHVHHFDKVPLAC